LALAGISALCFAGLVYRFFIGYQLWLCAYAALAVAILAAWLEDRRVEAIQ